MSNRVDCYRVRSEECCIAAVRADDNNRRIHWLEAATRWVALSRQEAAAVTTSGNGPLLTLKGRGPKRLR
jgi:hypothetical protein